MKKLGKIGTFILGTYYSGSITKALQRIYVEHNWKIWRFENHTAPKGFWENITNQKELFDYIAFKLEIKRMEDWYNISSSQAY